MEQEKLIFFKELLYQQLRSLVDGASKTLNNISEAPENLSDSIDIANYNQDTEFALRLRDRERRLIVKIREALKRIDDGSFGICENCGAEISYDRLLVRPVTTHCIDCKTEAELLERQRGE